MALLSGPERNTRRTLGFEYVAFIDSDLTNPPEDLLKIGAARKPRAHVHQGFAVRLLGAEWYRSRSGGKLSPVRGTPSAGDSSEPDVRDITNGFRAVRTDAFPLLASAGAGVPDHRRGTRLGLADRRRASGVPHRPHGAASRSAGLDVHI